MQVLLSRKGRYAASSLEEKPCAPGVGDGQRRVLSLIATRATVEQKLPSRREQRGKRKGRDLQSCSFRPSMLRQTSQSTRPREEVYATASDTNSRAPVLC